MWSTATVIEARAHPGPGTGADMSDAQDTRTHFDLVVIGGGPGGYATALYATSAG